MLKNFQHSLRAIADEALATAKELRDAHNPEHWDKEQYDTTFNIEPLKATISPAPSDDVSVRLAALKAKLAAKGPNAPTLSTITRNNVQQPQQQRRQEFELELERVKAEATKEAEKYQTQIELLRQSLTAAQEQAKNNHIGEGLETLEEQLKSAREQIMSEKSRISQLESQNEHLMARLEHFEIITAVSDTFDAEDVGQDALKTDLQRNVDVLRELLNKSEAEKAAVKQQLARLKAQMLSEQEDEEEKIRWRVDAEVKVALEQLKINNTAVAPKTNQKDLELALERVEQAQEAARRWEQTAAAKDAELTNLQRALVEMSYESDAAERLRAGIRAMQAEIHTLRNELDASKLSAVTADKQMEQAKAELAAFRLEIAAIRNSEAEAQREVLAARVAAQNALKELAEVRKMGGAIDRTIVISALIDMMRVKKPKGALQAASKTLSLTSEEIEGIEKELLRRPSTSVTADNAPSLATKWIDFLQADGAES